DHRGAGSAVPGGAEDRLNLHVEVTVRFRAEGIREEIDRDAEALPQDFTGSPGLHLGLFMAHRAERPRPQAMQADATPAGGYHLDLLPRERQPARCGPALPDV